MPELPEVETIVRGLRPLVGATIVGVERVDPRLANHPLDDVHPRMQPLECRHDVLHRRRKGARHEHVEVALDSCTRTRIRALPGPARGRPAPEQQDQAGRAGRICRIAHRLHRLAPIT